MGDTALFPCTLEIGVAWLEHRVWNDSSFEWFDWQATDIAAQKNAA